MTKVLFNIGQDTIYGVYGVDTLVTAKAATRRISGDLLITRNQLRESDSKPFTIDLAPTSLGQAWIITVSPDNGDTFTGYYKVPAGDTVNFTDLIEVDPDTLDVDQSPDPEWWAVAGTTVNGGKVVDDHLILTRNDGVEVDAGNVRGLPGEDGVDGEDGRNGAPGLNGVSVVYTEIDANGDLLVTLSDDRVVNAGRARGADGVDGTGVLFQYAPLGTPKMFSDGVSTYPAGVTEGLYSAPDGGWPLFGRATGFVKVVTHRHNVYTGTGYQIISRYQGDDQPMVRHAISADVWSELKEQASTDPVTDLTNGLMLSSDKLKLDRIVHTSPEHFGAVGDGVADDTAAVAAWLNSGNKYLSATGSYLITSVTCSDSVIICGGEFIGSTLESTMFTFENVEVSLKGVTVNGGGLARVGVLTVAGKPHVSGCMFHSFSSNNSTAAGLLIRNCSEGYSVMSNEFHDIYSSGDGVTGNSNGASRAIAVSTADHTLTGEVVEWSSIKSNTIRNVEGEEGDAIQIVIMPGYESAKCVISDNDIFNFSRRGIKIQASDVEVNYNHLDSDAVARGHANPSHGIDFQYGSNNSSKGNTVKLVGHLSAISCVGGASPDFGYNNRHTGNNVSGGNITMTRTIGGGVNDNVIETDHQWPIYIQSSPDMSVRGNIITATDSAVEASALIYLGFNSDGYVMVDNISMKGQRPNDFYTDSVGVKVSNHKAL